MKTFNFSFLLLLVILSATAAFAQRPDRDQYIGLYNQREYDKAATMLKRVTRENASDAEAWLYLGLSHLALGKEKDATKALEKSISRQPASAQAHTALAYAYVLRNDSRASKTATEALKLNPRIAEAHYVLGVTSIRNEMYSAAYDRAKKAVDLDPNFAAAYLLKSQALVSSFAKQAGTVIRPPKARSEMVNEAYADLQKYLQLTPHIENRDYYENALNSLKFFAEYYDSIEDEKAAGTDATGGAASDVTPVKILSKKPVPYTERARSANISGTIRLLVGFSADGTVKHVLVVKPLGYGLDEEAVRAARQIKFEPKKKAGKPVPAVLSIEYSFVIY